MADGSPLARGGLTGTRPPSFQGKVNIGLKEIMTYAMPCREQGLLNSLL